MEQKKTNNYYISMFQDSEREFVVTHNANIKPVSYFVGRETELQELRQRIEQRRKSVLVSGMGGIGKTQICRKMFVEYIEKYLHDGYVPFRHIGYIEYSGDMGSSLQNCLKYKEQDNPEQNLEAAWRELEYLASGGKLLLFVDNVDGPIGEDSGLQRLKGIPGVVVLTSRQASVSDEFEPYRIGFLDMEQCREIYEKIRFVSSRVRVGPEEVQDLEYIIESLVGLHTVTVELLAHLARTKRWTVKKLREELEQKGFRLQFHTGGELVNIQESYEKLYDLSTLTEAEQNILEAFSVFPYIPLASKTCNEWLLADAGVSENEDILMGLYHKGWLQFDIEQESYVMYPVWAQFIYDKCRPIAGEHSGLIKKCQDCMKITNSVSILECQKFIPFAENIVTKMNMGKELGQVEFISTYAYLLQYLGRYEEAEKLYNWRLEIHKERLGENHPDTATSYDDLGRVYERRGEYEKAGEMYKKSLKICEEVLGEDHPSTADSYNNLAVVYVGQGEYGKAEELYRKSLSVHKRMLGENHPSTATIYNNLALMYVKRGEYEKAEELYEKSLGIRERMLGEDHPLTADSYNNLAEVYLELREYGKAKKLQERNLRIRKKVLGEDHPSTAISYNNLARVYEEQGEYRKAEKLYRKSLSIHERVLGENHPSTAIGYNNLAVLYESQGKYKDAMTYYLKAYKIFVFKFGEEHPYTKNAYESMEKTYSEWNTEGDFEQWLEEKMKEEE